MPAIKLKKAPLKEAIFEVFWQLPLDMTNFPTDPDFDLALGKFQDILSNEFPVNKSLEIAGNSFRIFPKPSWQFWKGELEWPVIQLGHGILAVNDTDKNYIWENTYRPNIVIAINALLKAYKRQPKFNRSKLTYINAIEYNPQEQTPLQFVSENLKTTIHTEYNVPGLENNLLLNRAFDMNEIGLVQINIQNGINNANMRPSIIWTIAVERSTNFTTREEILDWVDRAHTFTHDFFVKMLKPEFYESFER